MEIRCLVFCLLLLAKTCNAVRGCTVIAIQPDLLWKKAVCDSYTSILSKIPSELPDRLISLRVTQQLIRRLEGSELRKLVYLEEFYLDSCQLEKIDLDVFEGLNRLRILSLRNNSLRLDESGLVSTMFYHLPALEVLDLSENPLGQIPANFFPISLSKTLFELRLSHIKGEMPLKLEASTFAALQNLQILDLSFCRLETLSSDFRTVFNRMEKLQELQLGGNPWHCDCNLRWLREWYLSDTLPSMRLSYDQNTRFGTTNTITPTCKSPYPVKRRQILIPPGRGAIEPEEFICKQWIESDQKEIAATLGSNVSLACHGYFETMKKVQWYKNHLPLVTPSLNYVTSQSDSLEFIAFLNISRVRYEDAGIWECGIDDGNAHQRAAINVTVKVTSGANIVLQIGEAQRQNLVYAGIGVAVVFILLTAIALAVFCFWGKHGADKMSHFPVCASRLKKSSAYGLGGVSNEGDDARELIGTRTANSHPDSPVPGKRVPEVGGYSTQPVAANTSQLPNQTASLASVLSPTTSAVVADRKVSGFSVTSKVSMHIPSPKLMSLTTATTTTAVLTQPTSAMTIKQPVSPQSTVLLATDFSSPSISSMNANYADFYRLPISGSYGAVPLPSQLLAQIAATQNTVAAPTANNPFLVTAPCPIHGLSSKLQNDVSEKLTQPTTSFDPCPIHGSPASVASRNATTKKVASSFTQTPRNPAKCKSFSSLHTSRLRTDKSSFHTDRHRRDSSSSLRSSNYKQVQYRTLPSRVNHSTIPSCPIHGQLTPSTLKRRSSSMSFDSRNRFSGKTRRAQSITIKVPYCSSCDSTSSTASSDEIATNGADFEDYSSDLSGDPAAECSDSGSSDFMIDTQKSSGGESATNSGIYPSMCKYQDYSASPSHEEETNSLATQNNVASASKQWIQRHQAHAVLGKPLVLTTRDSGTLLSHTLAVQRRSSESLGKRIDRERGRQESVNDSRHQHHSIPKESIPSSGSSSQIAPPKSILVKDSSQRRQRKRSSDFKN